MRTTWNGVDVNVWASIQTLNPPVSRGLNMYSGYDDMVLGWQDIVPAIPLDIRYANFCDRLKSFKART